MCMIYVHTEKTFQKYDHRWRWHHNVLESGQTDGLDPFQKASPPRAPHDETSMYDILSEAHITYSIE